MPTPRQGTTGTSSRRCTAQVLLPVAALLLVILPLTVTLLRNGNPFSVLTLAPVLGRGPDRRRLVIVGSLRAPQATRGRDAEPGPMPAQLARQASCGPRRAGSGPPPGCLIWFLRSAIATVVALIIGFSVLVLHLAAVPRPHSFFVRGVLARLPAEVSLPDDNPSEAYITERFGVPGLTSEQVLRLLDGHGYTYAPLVSGRTEVSAGDDAVLVDAAPGGGTELEFLPHGGI